MLEREIDSSEPEYGTAVYKVEGSGTEIEIMESSLTHVGRKETDFPTEVIEVAI